MTFQDVLIPFFVQYHVIILALHSLGVILGFGGAIITDMLFFKFLKDYRISKKEKDVMDILSRVIWVGIFLLILTGIALYLPKAAVLNQTPRFLVKVIAVVVIVVNGTLLHHMISPRLIQIPFAEVTAEQHKKHHLRKISFALGAISITSWSTVFILGSFKAIHFEFPLFLGLYLGLLAVAIVGSQIVERIFTAYASRKATLDTIVKNIAKPAK